jgi:dephospho-CoA kinase
MITFVCGQLCSGKTRYAKAMADSVNALFIEVGDIVREITQTTDRAQLQDTKNLLDEIVERLIRKMPLCDVKEYVVCGVRQKEILLQFPDATMLWIECPKKERKKRYKERARQGDTTPFKEAEQGDIELGILEVKQYIFDNK